MLEDGEIIEQGSHAELLDSGGKYAEMWRIQAGNY
jgi:ATP-binding cassette subfamily B protein